MTKSFDEWFGGASQNRLFWESPSKASKMGFEAGQQSKQAEVDELQKRIDRVVHILTYTNHASTPLCDELREILKGNTNDH